VHAGDGDHAVLQRLAQGFQDAPRELGELVEEEQPVVGERDLAGLGHGAAAHQAGPLAEWWGERTGRRAISGVPGGSSPEAE
jgi:hypothetical protein